jgi:hypothetical protein
MKKSNILICIIFAVSMSQVSFSQVKIDSSEITSSVPQLTSFHEIIYPIWHKAYPAKDIASLKGFVPQIKASMEALNKAALPGILKDKEIIWKSQLQQMNIAAENYYKAAGGTDDEAMLSAAESLHHNFEMLSRVIRPVMKEMDDYHQILYIIYHKLYPEKKYNEISGFMDSLVERADAIRKCPAEKLKKKLGDNYSRFEPAAEELYKATVNLRDTLKGNDPEKKNEAVQHMHSMYENLEALFK